MNFTSRSTLSAFDFTKYSLEEIRGALKLICEYSPTGAMAFNTKSRELSGILRERNLGPSALLYMQSAGRLSTRVVTPFNLQGLCAEKFADYNCTSMMMNVSGVSLPLTVGFANYKNKIPELEAILPGVKIVPFDAVLAMNVATVAGMTKYSADKSGGKVVPVTPPTNLYPGAPYDASALCLAFNTDLAGVTPLSGLDWAHFLYQNFFNDRVDFLKTIATYIILPEAVLNADKNMWTKTFRPEIWPTFKPRDDVQRIECLSKMQAYRSKDNAGVSAMTYGVYGEDFGSSYRLSEKMTSFEIFVASLPTEVIKCPMRYISNDEKDLVSAHTIMKKYGYQPKHYYGRALNGIESSSGHEYVYTDQIIFHPKCCTKPFTGKCNAQNVAMYAAENVVAADDRLEKFRGAKVIGFKAHVLGLEGHCIGMATPHNGVGVMVMDNGPYTQNAIWNTIMVAGHVRNTFLFHRKTFAFMIELMQKANENRKNPFVMIDWISLRRPQWHPFTKEQRKRIIVTLNEFERFGVIPDNISDQDLLAQVSEAQEDPDYLVHLGKNKEEERVRNDVSGIRVRPVAVKSPVPVVPPRLDGDNLEDEMPPPEVARPKLTGTVNRQVTMSGLPSVPPAETNADVKAANFYGRDDKEDDSSGEDDSHDPLEGQDYVVTDTKSTTEKTVVSGGSEKPIGKT